MHGIIVLDKPTGPTSASALAPLKRCLGRKVRVGHAGTLDPMASGVLLTLVGDATRLSSLAMSLVKRYEAVVRFGLETDTLDADGVVLERADPGEHAPRGIHSVLRGFVGEIEQLPPAHSALKVGGRRAYDLARSGSEPPLAPRRVRIHEIELLATDWPEISLRVVCGSGTYVRSLARDLGRALELPATLMALRRTAVGPFTSELGIPPQDAVEPHRIAEHLRSPRDITRAAGLEDLFLEGDDAIDFVHGRTVETGTEAERGSTVATIDVETEDLLGLAEILPEGRIRAVKVLTSQRERLLG